MEGVQIFHMNKGNGETSYAQNSKLQNKILTLGKPIIKEALLELLGSDCKDVGLHSMGIADFGCSSGPNTLFLIMSIMDVILDKLTTSRSPFPSFSIEFRVFLIDLFANDFNTIFTSLPAFYDELQQDDRYKKLFGANPNVFVSATPGCFYGRLFPSRSLHLAHSSSSLHWLSQLPPSLGSDAAIALNKGKVYISKSSPQCVMDAYAAQFSSDFEKFLKSRAQEIVGNGRMVLSFMSRPTLDHKTEESFYYSYQWELLSLALMSMVSDGLVKEERVDSFNVPYYSPCEEEVKSEVQKEGSFIVDKLEAFEVDWGYVADVGDDDQACGKRLAKTMRAVVESVIEAHFGEEIMDDLFQRYAGLLAKHLLGSTSKYRNVVISLIRRD